MGNALREALPGVLGGLELRMAWAFVMDDTNGSDDDDHEEGAGGVRPGGVDTHSDMGKVGTTTDHDARTRHRYQREGGGSDDGLAVVCGVWYVVAGPLTHY